MYVTGLRAGKSGIARLEWTNEEVQPQQNTQ